MLKLFGPEIRGMLEQNDLESMKVFCETLHPATVAEALAEDFEVDDIWRVLEQTNIRNQAVIFEYFPSHTQVEMTESTGQRYMARLIEEMSHDDRVDLLRRLPEEVAEQIIRLVDEADRRDIATLFRYAEDSVGAIMTTDYAWVPSHLNAGEAIERMRQQAPDKETIYYVFVLDAQTRKLVGVASLRDLILAKKHTPIRSLMEEDLVTLRVTDDREVAAEELAKYDFLALPVIDAESRLVGIVTHDDAIDVVVREATEDIQRQGAVAPFEEDYLHAPFRKIWLNRTAWLAVLFLGGLGTFWAMSYFEKELESVKVLAFFIPLCVATGGNTGTQASSLITRALALGQVQTRDWLRVLRHECFMGLAMGAALGLLGILRSLTISGELLVTEKGEPFAAWELGLVIGAAVAAICLAGTLIGALLPIVLQRAGIDPGIASSPLVATLVDLAGIFIYFSIAGAVLL